MSENIEQKVSIVVPAYNEEDNIRETVESMARMFRSSGLQGELLLVNDGSTDGTLAMARGLQQDHPELRIITYGRRRGLTRALEAGFESARGHIIVFYPADLQFTAEDIPHMVAKVNEGFDIVTGWKQGNYEKGFVSAIYNFVTRWLFDIHVHDMNSVKAFRREILPCLDFRSDFHRYMVVMAVQAGFTAGEVKVRLFPRASGKSKFGSPWRALAGVLDCLAMWFQYRFLTRPLLLFGSLGLASFLAGFMTGAVALYLRFVYDTGFRPLLTLSTLLLTLGALFFAIGLLGEAVQAVNRRVQKLEQRLQEREARGP